MLGLRGATFLTFSLLVDTNEEQWSKILQYCSGVHYDCEQCKVRGAMPPNLKLGGGRG